MEMKRIMSANLAAAGYDPATREMHIEFQTGDVYSYDDVSEDVYSGLFTAGSAGHYFHNFIRGRYRYYKV